MAFLNWIKNHIVSFVAIFVGFAAIIVSGAAFASSRNDYSKKIENYELQQRRADSLTAKVPESVSIKNGYVTYENDGIKSSQSKYNKYYLFDAHSAKIAPLSEDKSAEYKKVIAEDDGILNEYISSLDRSGGAITFTITADEAGYADIAIEMASNWINDANEIIEISNITDKIKIQVNKLEVKTTKCALPALDVEAEYFTTLVLGNVWLLKGNNTLTFTTSAYNDYKTDANKILYVMPDIRNVAVMSSVGITMPTGE